MKQLRDELELSPAEMARYMGVSRHTYAKWESGERGQSAAVKRLVHVLTVIKTMNPSLHDELIRQAKED